jgi:CRP-like cAMP-binding protein
MLLAIRLCPNPGNFASRASKRISGAVETLRLTARSNSMSSTSNLETFTVADNEALQNHLLAALSEEEIARLLPELQPVSLTLGQVIYESGEQMEYVYFPTTAIISLLYIMENGATAEIGVVGNDGLVGIALFMGGDTTPNRAVVQSAGRAFKMRAHVLKREFIQAGRFHNLMLRYTQALITQISQTAVCNRLHSVDQQLCRWLLLSHDRLPSDRLIMTHDLIANMLGVRREGVTHAAKRLQDAGYISYVRGDMTILDRRGLEEKACECYQVVRNEYDRLFG